MLVSLQLSTGSPAAIPATIGDNVAALRQCPTEVHRRARGPDERSETVEPITTTDTDESDSSRALTFHDYLAVAVLLTDVHAGGGRGS